MSDGLYRIIIVDNKEILYDFYWTTLGKWTCSERLSSKCFYSRMAFANFLETTTFIKNQPLTRNELDIFKPDLPLRAYRQRNIQWQIEYFDNLENYSIFLNSFNVDISTKIIFEAPEIILYPYGPKGGLVKPTKIGALNGHYFTYEELLWNAQNLQSVHLKEETTSGIGIFRLGHEKKLPSFYIGNYVDRAEFLKTDL